MSRPRSVDGTQAMRMWELNSCVFFENPLLACANSAWRYESWYNSGESCLDLFCSCMVCIVAFGIHRYVLTNRMKRKRKKGGGGRIWYEIEWNGELHIGTNMAQTSLQYDQRKSNGNQQRNFIYETLNRLCLHYSIWFYIGFISTSSRSYLESIWNRIFSLDF